MISPYEQFVPKRPSFIFWSLNIGLVCSRGTSGLVSFSGRGAVGLRSSDIDLSYWVGCSLRKLRSAELEGVAGRTGELHPHGLDLGVLVEGVGAVLAAEPALPEPAERGVGAEHAVGVDPHRARAELGGHPVRPLHVAGPHGTGEAVRGVVGELERLLLGAERQRDGDRPEDLLADHGVVGPGPGEQGGLYEEPAQL